MANLTNIIIINENDFIEIDITALHEQDKARRADNRRAEIKARKHKANIPVTAVDEQFYEKSAKAKKYDKRASAKASRRASEMVNSSRGLYHKVYSDIDARDKNYYA